MISPFLGQQPIDDFGLFFDSVKYNASLISSSDTALTIPGVAPRYKAVIKVTGPVWVAYNNTAASPGSSAFIATNSELINVSQNFCREVRAADVLHFFSLSSSADVSVVLYSLLTNN